MTTDDSPAPARRTNLLKPTHANKAKRSIGRGPRGGLEARPGIAMLLALSAVAVAAIVGLGLTASLPATTHASRQPALRDAAVYLAESGVVEGLHRLRNPSEADPEWSGVRNRRLDDMGGAYDVSIVELDEETYRIIGTGRIAADDGRTVEHRVHLDVRVDGGAARMMMSHAAVFGGASTLPDSARVHGDAHVNGDVVNLGRIHGELSATGEVDNRGRVDSIAPSAAEVAVPDLDIEAYRSYSHEGAAGAARVIAPDDLESEGWRIDPVTGANPLGVVFIDGDVELRRNVYVRGGIVVVNGDLTLNGNRLKVRGPRGHASLVVAGDVRFNWWRSRLRVQRGAAIIRGDVQRTVLGRWCRLDAFEGLVLQGDMPAHFHGWVRVRYNQLRRQGPQPVSFFADVEQGTRTIQPVAYRGRDVD